jgi:hypothetical protein
MKNMADNKSEYSELIDFLIPHFSKIDEEFKKINEKLETKANKSDIDLIIKTKADKSDTDRLMNRMGQILDKAGDDRTQQFKTQRQVDCHEKWHHQIAEKIGLKLEN